MTTRTTMMTWQSRRGWKAHMTPASLTSWPWRERSGTFSTTSYSTRRRSWTLSTSSGKSIFRKSILFYIVLSTNQSTEEYTFILCDLQTRVHVQVNLFPEEYTLYTVLSTTQRKSSGKSFSGRVHFIYCFINKLEYGRVHLLYYVINKLQSKSLSKSVSGRVHFLYGGIIKLEYKFK